jgi:polysaccharide export outer membrane protein
MDISLFQFDVMNPLTSPQTIAFSSCCDTGRFSHFRNEIPIVGSSSSAAPKMNMSPPSHSLFITHLFLGLAIFLVATPALGQAVANGNIQSPPPPQSPSEFNRRLAQASENLAGSSVRSQDAEYRIGPDDLLNISVFEAPEMNCSVRVSARGEISLQLLGAVHAAGLTPRELESTLQGLLRGSYMKNPHVGVFIQELQSHPVSVVGAVKMPGVFQIRGMKTLIEVLSMAEGLADDAGDTVVIMHGAGYANPGYSEGLGSAMRSEGAPMFASPEASVRNASVQTAPSESNHAIEEIDLKKLLESDDSAMNAPVRPGDIVKVSRAGIVYVVGEVQKPGGFVLQNNENISVLQALALAMGPTHTSAISRSRIIRTDPDTGKRNEIPMNLAKILSGKLPDSMLQAKDIVFVPNSAAKSVLFKGSVAALQTATGLAIYRW